MQLISQNLRCRAKDGTWVFVEVKRRTRGSIPLEDLITPAKQKRVVEAALRYLKKQRLYDQNVRFDVVLIEGAHLDWIPGAFEPTLSYTY